jgi:hypothetical protein
MFYRGLKIGAKLYRKTKDGVDVSEIKSYEPSEAVYKTESKRLRYVLKKIKKFRRTYHLIPIVGNWNIVDISLLDDERCMEATVRLNPNRWTRGDPELWVYGTDFNKVYESTFVECESLD